MTKNEQNRVVAWRLKILRQANDLPRGVADFFGFRHEPPFVANVYSSPSLKRFLARPRPPLGFRPLALYSLRSLRIFCSAHFDSNV